MHFTAFLCLQWSTSSSTLCTLWSTVHFMFSHNAKLTALICTVLHLFALFCIALCKSLPSSTQMSWHHPPFAGKWSAFDKIPAFGRFYQNLPIKINYTLLHIFYTKYIWYMDMSWFENRFVFAEDTIWEESWKSTNPTFLYSLLSSSSIPEMSFK